MKCFLLATAALFFSLNIWAADDVPCTPVLKTTKYKVEKGDHIAFILRKFQQEPVFGSFGSLNKLLKLNQIANQDLIEPNDEIAMPFKCEEDVKPWMTVDKGEYRLITLDQKVQKKSEVMAAPAVVPPVAAVPNDVIPELQPKIISEDQTLNDILKPESGIKPTDVDTENRTPEEISEALRYRMICEGEWTGTQCITRYSTLYAAGSGWFNRYDGTDPNATTNNKGLLLSRMNPQIQVGWMNYWTENIKTEISAGVQNNEILPEAREIPIESDKKILSSIYAEARFETGAFGYGIGLKNYDKIFYRFRFSGLSTPCLSNNSSFAGCGVFVHTANIMSYFADANWIFYQAGKFSYDAKITGSYLGGTSVGGFDVYSGYGADIEFTVKHDRVREYLYATLHYGVGTQDTSIEVQTTQELGFIFGYAWKLKDW